MLFISGQRSNDKYGMAISYHVVLAERIHFDFDLCCNRIIITMKIFYNMNEYRKKLPFGVNHMPNTRSNVLLSIWRLFSRIMLLTLRFVFKIKTDALELMHKNSDKAERVRAFFLRCSLLLLRVLCVTSWCHEYTEKTQNRFINGEPGAGAAEQKKNCFYVPNGGRSFPSLTSRSHSRLLRGFRRMRINILRNE